MKGVVFVELLDMCEERYGLEVLDAVLQASGVEHLGAYTSVGSYDWRELAAIVDALAAQVGETPEALMRAYGQHLFSVLARSYPQISEAASAFDLLENVESYIHPEVRRLYPDAELPHFDIVRSDDQIVMHYQSQRPLADFARGLIEGCLLHFAMAADVEMEGGGRDCRFVVSCRQESRAKF